MTMPTSAEIRETVHAAFTAARNPVHPAPEVRDCVRAHTLAISAYEKRLLGYETALYFVLAMDKVEHTGIEWVGTDASGRKFTADPTTQQALNEARANLKAGEIG